MVFYNVLLSFYLFSLTAGFALVLLYFLLLFFLLYSQQFFLSSFFFEVEEKKERVHVEEMTIAQWTTKNTWRCAPFPHSQHDGDGFICFSLDRFFVVCMRVVVNVMPMPHKCDSRVSWVEKEREKMSLRIEFSVKRDHYFYLRNDALLLFLNYL